MLPVYRWWGIILSLLTRFCFGLTKLNWRGGCLLCSCMDGLGHSCLVVVLLAMFLDSDLPPMVAMEIVQRARGPAAIQTIKVCVCHPLTHTVPCTGFVQKPSFSSHMLICVLRLVFMQQYNFAMDFRKNLSEYDTSSSSTESPSSSHLNQSPPRLFQSSAASSAAVFF